MVLLWRSVVVWAADSVLEMFGSVSANVPLHPQIDRSMCGLAISLITDNIESHFQPPTPFSPHASICSPIQTQTTTHDTSIGHLVEAKALYSIDNASPLSLDYRTMTTTATVQQPTKFRASPLPWHPLSVCHTFPRAKCICHRVPQISHPSLHQLPRTMSAFCQVGKDGFVLSLKSKIGLRRRFTVSCTPPSSWK